MKLFSKIFLVIFLISIPVIFYDYFFYDQVSIDIKTRTYSIFISDNLFKKSFGLSLFKKLNHNQGMLFLYDEPLIPSYWMYGMNYPLDIIFLLDGRIVHIEKNVLPCEKQEDCIKYTTESEINSVLELTAGSSSNLGLDVGDEIEINIK